MYSTVKPEYVKFVTHKVWSVSRKELFSILVANFAYNSTINFREFFDDKFSVWFGRSVSFDRSLSSFRKSVCIAQINVKFRVEFRNLNAYKIFVQKFTDDGFGSEKCALQMVEGKLHCNIY